MSVRRIYKVTHPQDYLRALALKYLNVPNFYADAQFLTFFNEKSEPVVGYVYENFTSHNGKDFHAVQFHVYILDKRAVNRQILSELTTYPFTRLNVRRLWSIIPATQQDSIRVAEKFGAKREGVLRQGSPDGRDAYLYALVNGEHRTWEHPARKRPTP